MSIKKLLIINPKQFGYVAGYHNYCRHLRDDYNIRFVCFDHGMKRIEMGRVDIIYLRQHRLRYLRLVQFSLYVLNELRCNKYDAVFMVYHKLAWLIGLFSKNKNIILDIRTGDLNSSLWIRKFFNSLTRFSTLCFPKVTILSESLLHLLKLNSQKCTILPLGAERFNCDKDFDSIHLLYIGILNKRDIDRTIKGFARFYRQYSGNVKISYDIVGYGSNKEENLISDMIKAEQLERIAVFHGRKHHGELTPFLEKCNVGVSYVPMTPFFDNQPPTKTFEYILSGMVCISTATSESMKFINKKNGVLCDSHEDSFYRALSKIYENRGSYDSKNIAATLEKYCWKNIVKNILNPCLK